MDSALYLAVCALALIQLLLLQNTPLAAAYRLTGRARPQIVSTRSTLHMKIDRTTQPLKKSQMRSSPTPASNMKSSSKVDSSPPSKQFNILPLLPIPALLFGGYELANAGNILMDPTKASFLGGYWRYFLSGAISCSVSHLVTVPFDVVKTRIQLESEKISIVDMSKKLLSEEGLSSFLTGAVPTASGYFVQGAMKYGFFEVFKPIVRHYFEYHYSDIVPADSVILLMVAAGMAESIGSSLLAPFEAARIRLVSQPQYAAGILPCLARMAAEDGPLTAWFQGLPALLFRNVPYTVMQLSVFESLTRAAYDALDAAGVSAAEAYDLRFAVTTATALVAAISAGLVSQPGDTLLSIVNQSSKPTAEVATAAATAADDSGMGKFIPAMFRSAVSSSSSEVSDSTATTTATSSSSDSSGNMFTVMGAAVKELGLSGLYRGTSARMVHVSFIVVVQLLLYDIIKQACGIPITGMHH